MALLEYKCDGCGTETDYVEQPMKNRGVGFCMTCGKEQTFSKLFLLTVTPQMKAKDDGLGSCGNPRGTCKGGSCGCGNGH